MRLKRLSIKGFKSFADETDIHFHENLIGIVGPNGSGKSNVVDAIRWVLGEGKKSELRLGEMSDVIFSGAKNRKEGRVARVTLSFENTKNILSTEFSDVSISRILYRDGASEYRLNNVPCRKRDITDLFVDSGIGSNSYAIISLNMVEDILHDSGGSRRAMIEQAAGISKYKMRKKETLRKLKSTEEDLDRVQDLLFEIEKSMKMYERQARRTERFNKIKEQYRDLAIKVSHIEVKEFRIQLKELSDRLQQEEDQRLKLNVQLSTDEANLQRLKAAILSSEKILNEDQQTFNKLVEKIGKVENEKNLSLQGLTNTKERLSSLDKSMVTLSESLSASQQKLKSSQEIQVTEKQHLEEEEIKYQKLNKHYNEISQVYHGLRQKEKEIQNQLQANQLHKETLGREIEGLNTRIQITNHNIEEIETRIATILESKELSAKELAQSKINWEEAAIQVSQLEKSIHEEEKSLARFNETLSQKMQSLAKGQSECAAMEQRIRFLTNIVENHEGLPEAIKHILETDDDAQVFSDLITVHDKKLTPIVELFLHPYMHYLVTPAMSNALKMYESVRDAQKGKLHAFVLDQVTDRDRRPALSDTIPIDRIITIDEPYQELLKMLCTDVYVAQSGYEDFDLTSIEEGMTVLFPDDYLICSHGIMNGGSNTLFEGVQLGRKKILEQLVDDCSKLKDKVSQEEMDLEDFKARLAERQQWLQDKRLEVSTLRNEQEKLQRILYQIENKHRNNADALEQLSQQLTLKQEENAQSKNQVATKESTYHELSSQSIDESIDQALSAQIESAYTAYHQAGIERDEAQRRLFEVKNLSSIADKDVEYHGNIIEGIEKRLDEMKVESTQYRNSLVSFETRLTEAKKYLEEMYAEKRVFQEKLSLFEETYYKEKGQIFEFEEKITQLRSKVSRKDQLIANLSEKKSNLSYEVKAIHERNSIEFGIEIDTTAFPEEYEGEDLEVLKELRNKLQHRIRNYGDINPMAITAFNEIKERYDYISKERDDVLQSKVSLEETIQEIEKTASERFNIALENIRVNFRRVFQSLFSQDDDCDIVLLNNDDPLNANIEIMAKPKGKKPKSISQLSGGEKTLTAASFLFALYLLKPAPFCIFDEVDAPLDDVNVQKFNKIIREFSKDSQFIVITHNKLTMAEVDVLYGVYLKEQGVSGVSAVDFRKYESAELLEES